ncbi:MAG: carbohydrate binding family 9 domain-containing protein [Gammaproteobacteria bacterium]|nr:carbohydrate binding family 9 domain-containing protein [Gammaproteobacteria bacterium]
MRKLQLMLCLVSTVVLALFSASTFAVDEGLVIPKITGVPGFSDFQNMNPSTSLARSMHKISDFVQREPDDGDPATQRTDVYLGYDQEDLYVLFMAFDSQPDLIRANLSSRENIDGDDSVEITIDTFNDQRAAFTFRVTPLGIQWDARWTEGSSRRAGFDTTLEAVWDSQGQVTDQGYMARMAIPLRSLRFPDTEEQIWRIQIGRQIPRLGEASYWPEYSISIEGRLNQTALMSGIRDVSPGNNSQIIPFIFARDVDALDSGAGRFKQNTEVDVGVDAKFVFNDSMVLDLTLNPDFSQVESDEPQVVVNERFEVRFPERRPFFVENADFFATDSILVFTRRIVDPEGGARFTGRLGDYGFGGILINDQAPGLNRSAGDPLKGEKANIGMFRAFRDISDQNRVGVMVTDREFADGFNRVGSFDGRFKLTDNWITNMQLVGTETEPALGGESVTGYQRNIQLNRVGRMLNTHTHAVDTTKDFRTELGFQNRWFKADTTGLHNRFGLNFYPDDSSLNRWGVVLFGAYLEDNDGTRIYTQFGPSADLAFDTTDIGFGYTEFTEVLRPQDFPGIASPRKYKFDNWSVSFDNDRLETLSFEFNFRSGTALNVVPPSGTLPFVADSSRINFDMLWRPFDRLRISNTYFRTELETRSGGVDVFSNEIVRSNWNYQFNREWSLRFIAQYDKTDAGPATRLEDKENLNFDVLLRYVINPWSAFYVGYNTNQSNFDIVEMEGEREVVIADSLRKDGDQLFVKFSYLFQR